MIQYTLTLIFPNNVDEDKVTQVNYQVTGNPALQPPLPQNKMPASFAINDTLKFTYQTPTNSNVEIKSCLLTRYNITSSETEVDTDFIDMLGQNIPITDKFKGTWIFHLLGLCKLKGKEAAYYLDPEFTGGF